MKLLYNVQLTIIFLETALLFHSKLSIVHFTFYSYLSASIGSSFAAFLAG